LWHLVIVIYVRCRIDNGLTAEMGHHMRSVTRATGSVAQEKLA
jgi:hypothetical protein